MLMVLRLARLIQLWVLLLVPSALLPALELQH
jgi:hypothetical protein